MPNDSMGDLIINNILCYITSARKSLTTDQIIQCCIAFYNKQQIYDAKDYIFSLNNESSTRRRGNNAIRSEIEDIIKVLTKYEEDEIKIPKFVCDSFDCMPPSGGFEIVSLQIINLMEEITNLRSELKEIKDSGVRNNILIEDSTLIKNDLLQIKENIRDLKLKFYETEMRRLSNTEILLQPGYKPSAPILSQFTPNTNNGNERIPHKKRSGCSQNSEPSPLKINDEDNDDVFKHDAFKLNFENSFEPLSKITFHTENGYASAVKAKSKAQEIKKTKQIESPKYTKNSYLNNINRVNKLASETDEDGFTKVVSRRKRHQKVLGTRSSTTMKSAPRSYDLFVGNFNCDVEGEDIKKYIFEESKIVASQIEEVKTRNRNAKFFKVSVSSSERDILLSADMWPVGIFCNKYYYSKSRY